VKLRKIEAIVRQLLDESTSLPKAKQEGAFGLIASKFVERVPQELLTFVAGQFSAAATADASAEGDVASGMSPWTHAAEETEANGHDEAEAFEDNEGATADDPADSYFEASQLLLSQTAKLQPKDWSRAWSQHCLSFCASQEEEAYMVATILEGPLPDGAGEDLAPRVVVELCRTKTVQLKSVEDALASLAEKLEDLIEINENAWQVFSAILMYLFPKTASSSFGWQFQGWNWVSWWQLLDRILSACSAFRAFDILVLVLQMMQENAQNLIKDMQVWKEPGRMAKVRKALATWGSMEESAVAETLQAYYVQLA
jgi:hypothetical protein